MWIPIAGALPLVLPIALPNLDESSSDAKELFGRASTLGLTLYDKSFQLRSCSASAVLLTQRVQGTWVVLQNCHLAASWLPVLEALVDKFSGRPAHNSFRLWLTTFPSTLFPINLLQKSVKVTTEQPQTFKTNILKTLMSTPVCEPAFFNGCASKCAPT
jgi:hypothetical protein